MAVVAFLRGMNVGKRRITNDELVAIFEDAGHQQVSAYQASGNVIFGAADSMDEVSVSALLADRLGYEVPVFVRTAAELETIASSSPIRGAVGADGGKPQIVFLRHRAEVDLATVFPDGHEVHALGADLHWLPPVGLGELGDLTRVMDKALGPTTVRTLGTIERLVRRLG